MHLLIHKIKDVYIFLLFCMQFYLLKSIAITSVSRFLVSILIGDMAVFLGVHVGWGG